MEEILRNIATSYINEFGNRCYCNGSQGSYDTGCIHDYEFKVWEIITNEMSSDVVLRLEEIKKEMIENRNKKKHGHGQGKSQCSKCKNWYVNLNQHVKRNNCHQVYS